MGWIRDRLFGRRSRRAGQVVQGGSCDCCNAQLGPAGTYYYLATRDVVLSELYWSHAFEGNSKLWTMFATSEEQLLGMFQEFVTRMASYATPWSICEDCSEYFFFDRDQARTSAINRTPPSGMGAVDASGCALFAALGWERATGRWPQVVPRPPARESCDFCDKTMYEGEIDFFVPEATYHRDQAAGTWGNEPLRPARTKNGEAGWEACFPCMSRHVALVDRQRSSTA